MKGRGTGCKLCNGSGYKGRVALYEVMPFTDPLKELVLQGASAAELKAQAIKCGLQTLRMSAIAKAMDGTTTTDEIVRCSQALESLCKPDKINVGALGNLVPQLHVHVVLKVFTSHPQPRGPQSALQRGLRPPHRRRWIEVERPVNPLDEILHIGAITPIGRQGAPTPELADPTGIVTLPSSQLTVRAKPAQILHCTQSATGRPNSP